MPISTVRATPKMFNAKGTVPNLPGIGPMFILPPCTVRRMIREAKISKDHCSRNTEESNILGSSSLQNYHWTSPPCQQIIWKQCQKKAFPVISPQTKVPGVHYNLLEILLEPYSMVTWNENWAFSATNTQCGFGVKIGMPILKITCM